MFKGKKEKEVRVLIGEHLAKVGAAVKMMLGSVNAYIDSDAVNAKEFGYKTHLAEHEADEKRRSIIERLHKGAFMPALREDLIKVIAQQDKIADRSESCCDFILTQFPGIPDALKDKFKELLKASTDTMEPYAAAAENMFIDYKVVSRKIASVNEAEEAADKVEWDLTKSIFKSDLELAKKMHLRDLVFHIVSISDVIEDAADDLDILIVKYRM